jgi:hypothetical protein
VRANDRHNSVQRRKEKKSKEPKGRQGMSTLTWRNLEADTITARGHWTEPDECRQIIGEDFTGETM